MARRIGRHAGVKLFLSLVFALGAVAALCAQIEKTPPPPGRGLFQDLVATARDGQVRLSFYQSTRFWADPAGRAKDPALVLRIHRREVAGMVFGMDYEEILNDLTPAQATLVWDGPLPAINERKYEFIDKTVQLGRTYAYWVSSNLGDAPTGPKAVRVRDPRTFWNRAEIDRRIDALTQAHPGLVTKKIIGTTVRGRPIAALYLGNPDKRIALVGSIHAGEAGPELILPALEKIAAENPEALRAVGIVAVPIINSDERERLAEGYPYYLRKNAAGVDLNRNFSALWGEVSYLYGLISSDPESTTYFGPRAESEPETRAIATLMAETRPLVVYSYHCVAALAGTDLVRSVASADDADYTARCEAVARAYTSSAIGQTEGPYTRLVCTGGSLATLMWRQYGVPAFDMEGTEFAPFGDMPTDEQMARFQALHTRGILGTLRYFGAPPAAGASGR